MAPKLRETEGKPTTSGLDRREFLKKAAAAAAAVGTAGAVAGCESPEEQRARAVQELPKTIEFAKGKAVIMVRAVQAVRNAPRVSENLPDLLLGAENDEQEKTIKQRWDTLSKQEKDLAVAVAHAAEELADALDLVFQTALSAGKPRQEAEALCRQILTDAGADKLGELTQADLQALQQGQTPRSHSGGLWPWFFWYYVMNSNRYNSRAWGSQDRLGRVATRGGAFGGRGSAQSMGRGGGFGGRGAGG